MWYSLEANADVKQSACAFVHELYLMLVVSFIEKVLQNKLVTPR